MLGFWLTVLIFETLAGTTVFTIGFEERIENSAFRKESNSEIIHDNMKLFFRNTAGVIEETGCEQHEKFNQATDRFKDLIKETFTGWMKKVNITRSIVKQRMNMLSRLFKNFDDEVMQNYKIYIG